MNIYIEKAGCSRRYAELATLYDYFVLNNHQIVNHPDQAHLILLATCAFKKKEEDHSMARVRTLKNYNAKLLIYGCLPDIAPSRFAEFNGVSFLAPKDIDKIDTYFDNHLVKFADVKNTNTIPEPQKDEYSPLRMFNKVKNEFEFSNEFFLRAKQYTKNKIRSSLNYNEKKFYLYLCRGCRGKCSYCAIRRAIGPLKSNSIHDILNQFQVGMTSGYNDYVILGDDVGAYGLDQYSTFPKILQHLVDASRNHWSEAAEVNAHRAGKTGFHIEEIHPHWLISYSRELEEIIQAGEVKTILCPIQSGNNRILNLMNRQHDVENIFKVLSTLRALNPKVKLFSQIVVGFPTENDDEFLDTLHFVKQMRFDAVTIFPFDAKENTPAAEMEPKIQPEVISGRIQRALKFFRHAHVEAFLSCQK